MRNAAVRKPVEAREDDPVTEEERDPVLRAFGRAPRVRETEDERKRVEASRASGQPIPAHVVRAELTERCRSGK